MGFGKKGSTARVSKRRKKGTGMGVNGLEMNLY